ncbi:hypothetical protein CI109_105177 [Kwoniella shandongensis]|uniref:Uncharacterized protein n=1 Tax=Kwoniella shandongensis TaxID=1734106 RepID=A0A5M6C3Q6_9TREE|nr:uncharacterized protein CI109_002018 [Kwoniella shandongensis]KAA5529593.1 hypothetical protein CI109_002018 [Kwoniella shandongensis]
MSFRTATRLSTRLASQRSTIQFQSVARRAASSTSAEGKKKSSDATWIMGSAVVFGSLGAFLLFPSNKTTHDALHSSSHAAVRAEINESAPTVKVGKDADRIQSKESLERDIKSEDPHDQHKQAIHTPQEMSVKKDIKAIKPDSEMDQSQRPEAQSGGKNANEVARQQHQRGGGGSGGFDEGEEKGASAPADHGAGGAGWDEPPKEAEERHDDSNQSTGEPGEPTAADIKASILRAERTNVPKAAMSEEEKGNDTQAEVKEEK